MSFTNWLAQLEKQYQSLSDAEKIQTLDQLIECSHSAQLCHLHTKLSCFLMRDFLSLLPRELAHHLLFYLDVKTLLVCSQVSRAWNNIISNCEERWKLACIKNGFTLELQKCGYKDLWQKSRAVICGINDQSAVESVLLFGHTDRVMAIYYHNGKLSTGSDDHFVRLWDCETGQCIKIFRTHTVADLKFNDEILLTGSFDTTAASWDLHSGQLIQRFHGHVAAVFSIDSADSILVTGSADSTVRLWDMNTGNVLKVLSQHRSAWITNVCLQQNSDGRFTALSRDNSVVYMWQFERENNIVILDHKELSTNSTDLLPGLHIRDNHVLFTGFQSSNSSYSIIETSLDVINPGTDFETKTRRLPDLPHNLHIEAYLGSGSQFDVFLVDDAKEIPRLEIYRRQEKIASIEISPQYRGSKRGSTFTLGNLAWLDGFDGDNNKGVIFAASMKDNSVYFLRWQSEGLPDSPRV